MEEKPFDMEAARKRFVGDIELPESEWLQIDCRPPRPDESLKAKSLCCRNLNAASFCSPSNYLGTYQGKLRWTLQV